MAPPANVGVQSSGRVAAWKSRWRTSLEVVGPLRCTGSCQRFLYLRRITAVKRHGMGHADDVEVVGIVLALAYVHAHVITADGVGRRCDMLGIGRRGLSEGGG